MIWAMFTLGVAKGSLAWLLYGLPTLEPDTWLYAQGGVGLFPSPLGRVVGLGGLTGLGVANVVANGALVAGVYRLTGRAMAGALVLVSPLGVWSIFAGMDTLAATALVWARAVRRSLPLELVAVGLHPAALLIVCIGRAAASLRGLATVGLLVGLGTIGLLATPYAPLVTEAQLWIVATGAIATAGVYLVTFAPFVWGLRAALPAIVGGALAAGAVAGTAWETNCRYMLPAVALGAADAFKGHA